MWNRHDVACLVLCLQLWLAKSSSKTITQHKGDVCASEGERGFFDWKDITQDLVIVQYVFENDLIAKSSSANLSAVKIKSERLESRFSVLEADNVAFQIDKVEEDDYGKYKIILTYINGDERELVGRLRNVTTGNFNITCDQDNICTCGNQNSSDVYSWVFHDGVGRNETLPTNRSELNVTGIAKNGSFHCVRHSDCQRSRCFSFTSGTMNLTFHKGRGEECWNLQCGEPLETKTTYYWSVRNTTYGKNESKPTDNTYELCSEYFGCTVKCKREYDCSETPWECFNGGITKDSKERRRKRALDVNSEQLHICEAIPEEHSASRTIIAVCVVVAVIVVIAVAVAAVWQFRKKRNSHTVPSRESDEPTFCVHKTDQPESLSFLAATTQSNDGSTCESGQKLEVAG